MQRTDTIATTYVDDTLSSENFRLKCTIDLLLKDIEILSAKVEPINNENIILRNKIQINEFKYISVLNIIHHICNLWKYKEYNYKAFEELKRKFNISQNFNNPTTNKHLTEYIQYCTSFITYEDIKWFETCFLRKYPIPKIFTP